MTFLPARPAKSRATPRQTDCLIYMGWTRAQIAQMSFREASKNILTFSKKACKLTHMILDDVNDPRTPDRWSDDSAKPAQAPTEEAPVNDMSAAAMAPDELFGDRLIACGLFLDCAIQTLVQCPLYPKEDCKIDTIVALLRNCKISLNDQLSRYPAASIQQGTVLANGQ